MCVYAVFDMIKDGDDDTFLFFYNHTSKTDMTCHEQLSMSWPIDTVEAWFLLLLFFIVKWLVVL